MTSFRALIVEEVEPKRFERRLGERTVDDLPAGELLVRVHYSSLNYKDALSATGNKGVTRRYPHTPGIDAAGVVAHSTHTDFAVGDEVVVIGYDLGMNTPGGLGEYIRVPAAWAVRRPPALSLQESMVWGTAGFTAALSVEKLHQAGVLPDSGPVAVTGATGGVGSLAVALLAKLGYTVTAVTGKLDQAPLLQQLGAAEVKHRDEFNDTSGRPMLGTVWAGAVDTVGGNTLATLLKSTQYGGAVTACGMVAGATFESSVFPFILRGVSLLGVDSVLCGLDVRQRVWGKIAAEWRLESMAALARTVPLEAVDPEIERLLQGEQIGRVVVKMV